MVRIGLTLVLQSLSVSVCAHAYVYSRVCAWVHRCVCMYVYMSTYMCVYVCSCLCVCAHTCTRGWLVFRLSFHPCVPVPACCESLHQPSGCPLKCAHIPDILVSFLICLGTNTLATQWSFSSKDTPLILPTHLSIRNGPQRCTWQAWSLPLSHSPTSAFASAPTQFSFPSF